MLQHVSKPPSLRKPLLLVVLLAAPLLGAPVGCGKTAEKIDGSGKAKAPQPVTLAAVKTETVEVTLKVVGTLHGEEEMKISAEVPGRVERVFADIGDRIAPGADLARIDTSNYESAVNRSRMALNEALTKLGLTKLPEGDFDVEAVPTVARAKYLAANVAGKFERAKRLFKKPTPLVSQEEYNDAEADNGVAQSNYDVARLEARSQLALARSRQSELESAQKRLGDTLVKAPTSKSVNTATDSTFAITKRYVAGGEYVREGDPIFDMVLDDPVKLRGSIPERYLAQVNRDQPVRISVESYAEAFEGKVSRINPAINQQNRSFEIEIAVPNGDHRLRPGAFAVGLVVVGRDEAVPFVPTAAIVSFAGVDRVFSVADGKAVEHIIQPGEQRGEFTAVAKGLENVKEVVVAGSRQLSDKDPVEVGVQDGKQVSAR